MRCPRAGCGTGCSRHLHGSFMTKKTLTPWLQAVDRAVRAIPRGQTASYARVALMAGKPGAARAVVQALHRLEGIPWWRVVRSDGTLAAQVAAEQGRRLAQEGVRLGRGAGKASGTGVAPKTNSPSRSQRVLRKVSLKKPK